MNHQINSYVAFLIITIIGAAVSLIIIRAANSTTFEIVYSTSTYDLPESGVASTSRVR